MTKSRPYLFLRRLVVLTHIGKIAFDETFHKGVNIIRGKNSSGKSTIANFIFYALGGDYSNWTSEALKCNVVFAEVEINGAVLTLKRNISITSLQPMSIYWNNFEEASRDSINWQTFPYKQSNDTLSYTNVLFKALSFPEVKSEAESNVTMHQLLRLMYIDQDTQPQYLFRFERFDLPLIRQATSELLLGIYDDSLYNQRLEYRTATKTVEEKQRQFFGITKILGQSGHPTDIIGLLKLIEEARAKLILIENDIIVLKSHSRIKFTMKSQTLVEKIQSELMPIKNRIRELQSRINQYEIELADSKQFIQTLEKRVKELDNSLLTRKVLGELPLTHCPQCLSPLESKLKEGVCILCKQPLNDESDKSHAGRLRQEMELQIRESKNLLEKKEKDLIELKGTLPSFIEKARSLQKQLNSSVDTPQTSRDEKLDEILIKKGGIEKEIELLTQQIQSVELLDVLKQEINQLNETIGKLDFEIKQKESQQKVKLSSSIQRIKENTLFILKHDLDRQEEFQNGKIVDVNFQKDTYTLDGNNNFSASSKIYFKNAVLFSIFFTSLEIDFFRYPRFILCDNTEDKGMEKERTQNFQRLIVSLSNNFSNEHQIILTTSMIADELNNTPYCVGEDYDRNNKTLKVL